MALSVTGRWMRWGTRLCILLGLLLLLAAPILRFWVAPGLAQSPAMLGPDGSLTHGSTGSITALFDLEQSRGVAVPVPIPVTRTQTSISDAAATAEAGSQGLNVSVATTTDRTVTDDDRLIAEVEYRLAADRRTQALVDCCGMQVDGVAVQPAGAGNPIRMPWFTPQAPYPFFDPVLLAPVALTPIGREDVEGMSAMKFQQPATPVSIGTVQVPGKLTGSSADAVGLVRTYLVNRTLWVDPTTGIILRQVERLRESLRDGSGRDVVTLLAMSTASTDEQVRASVAAAREQGLPVLWAHVYGPALCLALGLVLLLLGSVGVVVRVRAERADRDFPDELASFEDLKEVFD
jgi:hypothetical protein